MQEKTQSGNGRITKPPIFLISSGRCGSTLVQRLLNMHGDIVMWGEHQGFVGPLSRSYYLLQEGDQINRFVYGNKENRPELLLGDYDNSYKDIEWTNDIDKATNLAAYRELLLNVLCRNLDTSRYRWGFKEIRYKQGHHVLRFLSEIFDDAQFIFLFRHAHSVIKSALVAWYKEVLQSEMRSRKKSPRVLELAKKELGRWTDTNRYLLDYARDNDRAYILRYEDLINDSCKSIKLLFEFLGMQMPAGSEQIVNGGSVFASVAKFLGGDKARLNTYASEHAQSAIDDMWPDIGGMVTRLGYSQNGDGI